MQTMRNEQTRHTTIQELMTQGLDEQTTRLITALLDLVPGGTEERISKLIQIGRRYMLLALFKEEGRSADDDMEALLIRRLTQRKTCVSTSNGPKDQGAFTWYGKAGQIFSMALEHAPSPLTKEIAATQRSLVYTLCGANDLAQADLDLASSFRPCSPDLQSCRATNNLATDRVYAQTIATTASQHTTTGPRLVLTQ